ncbi:membrane protein [Bacteroidia bacterium]|nr:membrane protein [Bacteroidia bacterium]GHU69285.1 membrane protein [Bacteroidia bacterium]
MKRYIVYMGVFLALFSSCSDEWLETRPRDLITYEDFWKTREQLQSAVAGCYMSILNDNHINWEDWRPYEGVVGKMIQWGEIRGDNVIPAGSALDEEKKIATCNIIASNGVCNWAGFYSVINNCNMLLDNADRVLEFDETISQSEVNTYKAEALAIRALMYFYLVRNFKEVPLVTVSSKTNTQEYDIAKSSERVLLDKIIADLELARSQALVSYDNLTQPYNKGRFTRTSINALLADVYLWDEQYDQCIKACDEVLKDRNVRLIIPRSNNGYEWTSIFTRGNSNESIFELQYGNSQAGKPNTMLYQCYGSSAKSAHFVAPLGTSWSLNSLFLKENSKTDFDLNDIRYINGNSYLTSGTIYKFPQMETASANWIIYRLAEIYFMKAEALVQLDYEAHKGNAIHLVNQIWLRAHPLALETDTVYTSLGYNSKQELADLILKEKQKEFLFEGKRWYDLLRTSRREADPMRVFNLFIERNLDPTYGELIMAKYKNEWARYFPVPLHDMETNKLLVQNPFYITTIDGKPQK